MHPLVTPIVFARCRRTCTPPRPAYHHAHRRRTRDRAFFNKLVDPARALSHPPPCLALPTPKAGADDHHLLTQPWLATICTGCVTWTRHWFHISIVHSNVSHFCGTHVLYTIQDLANVLILILFLNGKSPKSSTFKCSIPKFDYKHLIRSRLLCTAHVYRLLSSSKRYLLDYIDTSSYCIRIWKLSCIPYKSEKL